MTELIRHGTIVRPSLGVALAPDQLTRRLGIDGVLLMRVEPGGPAAAAGLRPTRRNVSGDIRLGDVIVAIDEQPIGGTEDYFSALEEHEPGDEVRLTILRDRQRRSLAVTLGEEV